MAKEWKVECKDCGTEFGYSDYSYEVGSKIGHSRPERCPDCRKVHNRQTSAMGLAYYDLKPRKGIDTISIRAGQLGALTHPTREHKSHQIESKFDPTEFGVSVDDIKKLFNWFRNPEHQVAVVVGPTGSGKSTAVPYYLISPPDGYQEDFFTRNGQVAITQPRIQATRNLPAYVAKALFGSSIGSGFDIGFRYSNNPYSDWRNRLVYLTDGTLINWIVSGQISKLSVIMIDEAHERSLNIDLILGLLKKLLPRYPHLKLIIASATIDSELFVNYFGPDQTCIVEIQGKRKFNIQEYYADENEKLPYEDISKLRNKISSALAKKVLSLLKEMNSSDKEAGDILGFLQGVRQIDDAVSEIKNGIKKYSKLAEEVDVFPLYTTLPQKEQDDALKSKPDPNKRRVVITTNVAETSLTVEGVVYVVDSGLINESQWDSDSETKQVVPVLHSKAGCTQRWGRAGRIRDGEAYCLYTKIQFEELFPDFTIPQIRRSPLEKIVLTAKAAGIDDIENFDWIQKPPDDELKRAPEILKGMGALDEAGDLTEHGLELQAFAEEPKLANLMTFADRFACSIEMATLIPMIKVGGIKHFLKWNYDWDASTKQKVSKIHDALKVGCQDDIELCLKIYAAWDEMVYDGHSLDPEWAFRKSWPSKVPNLPDGMKEKLGMRKAKAFLIEAINIFNKKGMQGLLEKYDLEEEGGGWIEQVDKAILNCQREAWGKAFFINHTILHSKIDTERDKLLDSLSGHKKEDERRPIDFDLLDRIRLIIAYCFRDQIYTKASAHSDESGVFNYKKVFTNEKNESKEAASRTLIFIDNDSVLAEGKGEIFTSLKQHVITRPPSLDQPPAPILHLAYTSLIKKDWIEWLDTNPNSYISLGRYIANDTRESISGNLKSRNNYERLFLDLVYPLGTKFEFEVIGAFDDGYVELKPIRWIAESTKLSEDFRKETDTEEVIDIGSYEDSEIFDLTDTVLSAEDKKALVENPEEEIIPAWVDLANDTFEIVELEGENLAEDESESKQEIEVTKNEIRDFEGYLNLGSWPENPFWKAKKGGILDKETFTGVVAGFDFTKADEPGVIIKRVPDKDPFEYFEDQNFQIGEALRVVVRGHYQKPGDYFVALIVEETNSGLEILVEPTKVTFAGLSSILKELRPGIEIDLVIDGIDYERKKISLTCLPVNEEHLRKTRFQKKIREKVQFFATVKEVYFAKERVFFVIDEWCDFQQGIIHVISIAGGGLYKPAENFSIGEKVSIEIDFSERESVSSFANIPEEVEAAIKAKPVFARLTWYDDRLKITGPMAFSLQNEMIDEADNHHFIDAIDDLYTKSNRFWGKTINVNWDLDTKDINVDTIIPEAIVLRITNFGAFVEIKPPDKSGVGYQGLVHKSEMAVGGVDNPQEELCVGDVRKVIVIKKDTEDQKFSLSMIMPEDRPGRNLKVGQKIIGNISKVANYGVFVELEPYVEGLVHKSETWYRIDDPSRIFTVGDSIVVVIKSIDETRRISLTAKLDENDDPFNNLEVGKLHSGIVQNIVDFGAFIEISPGVSGLLHNSELGDNEVSIGDEVKVKIKNIDKLKRQVGLSMK